MVEKTPEKKSRRVVVGWSLFFAAVISVMVGGVVFSVILGIACLVACNEFLAMTTAKGFKPSHRIMRFMVTAFFVMTALPAIPQLGFTERSAVEHLPLLLTFGIVFSFFRLVLRRHEHPPASITDIATTILGFIYTGFLPCHLVLLRNIDSVPAAANPVLQPGLAYAWATLFIVFGTDVFAYYAGKKFGKHLLYPEISPKKTVEGALGGFIAALFWATLVFYLSDWVCFPTHPFSYRLWQAPLMGALVSIAAQLGDLCESLMKRDAGIKDSSTIIPGHGGILDRGDSVIFGSAVGYYFVYLVVLGNY